MDWLKRMIWKTRIFLLTSLLLYLAFSSAAHAASFNFQPDTWYEINTSSNPPPVIIEPNTMQIAMDINAAFQARAFWEYAMADITAVLQTIDAATIEINRIVNPADRKNHSVQVVTYEGDATAPVSSDFNGNVTAPDTFQNAPLPEGENVFDITAGLQFAALNDYEFFGVGVWVPSTINGILMNVEGVAQITITGTALPVTPIPEPSAVLLVGTGLAVLGYLRWHAAN